MFPQFSHLFLFLLVMGNLAVSSVAARTVDVPITVDSHFLQQTIRAAMYTGENGTAEVWNDGSGCNYLVLSDPQIETLSEKVRILSRGVGRVGTLLGEQCVLALDWTGFIEVLQQPRLSDDRSRIRFDVVDSEVYDENMQPGLRSGMIWEWSKHYVHPKLEAIAIDLQPALDELQFILTSFMPDEDAETLRILTDSVVLSDIKTSTRGLASKLKLSLPDSIFAETDASTIEPELSEAEILEFESAWQRWDAFITFVIKHAAFSTVNEEHRAELLNVLIEARHDLIAALSEEVDRKNDPVRKLFVKSWQRLSPVLQRMSGDTSSENKGQLALRFLSFIAAGDALKAIDELGPTTGWEVSTDGLRRMARLMAPESNDDPLHYDEKVDPAIRETFGFGAPLEIPVPPSSQWNDGWFIRSALALPDTSSLLMAKLNEWVPERKDLELYLGMVRNLLHETVSETLKENPLDAQFHEVYRPMVLATAWQETCWRQFKKEAGQIVPMKSSAGAVGMMQIVPQVWRGFYEKEALEHNIAYNAAAGSEILRHYLVKYAIRRGEHKTTGDTENLARATYAAYNGGPGHLSRYRKSSTPESLRKIDESFWKKYQTVKQGDELAVVQCYG